MGLYSRFLFPIIMDFMLGQAEVGKLRTELLAGVRGRILEIGIGTGLNLPYYPPAVRSITAVDINPGMQRLARTRMKDAKINVDYRILNGEKLPFRDASFDSLVTTFCLCSIDNAPRALREFRRVLKRTGKLFVLEHGLSCDVSVVWWQDLLTPLNKKLAVGCRLNRDMRELVEHSGFRFETFKNFYFPKAPRPMGFFYQGVAKPLRQKG